MRKLFLTLVPLALLACDRQPVAPAIDEGPSLDWMNNPDNGNPKIWRYQDAFAFCYTDPTNGLRACHATIPLGGGGEPDCGLQDDADGVAWQEIAVNEDVGRVVLNAMGDVWITIRDLNTAGSCFDRALVAEGWGRMHLTDNDIFGSSVNNANAWGWVFQGRLTAPDGGMANYNGLARLRFNNSQGLKIVAVSVNVN